MRRKVVRGGGNTTTKPEQVTLTNVLDAIPWQTALNCLERWNWIDTWHHLPSFGVVSFATQQMAWWDHDPALDLRYDATCEPAIVVVVTVSKIQAWYYFEKCESSY